MRKNRAADFFAPTLFAQPRHADERMAFGRVLLLVVFDDRSSLGLVKLRSKQISHELAKTFAEIEEESANVPNNGLPFTGITDEEIDSLFSPA